MPASKVQSAKTAKRREQALGLRLAGLTWEQIANRLGYASRGAACADVSRAMEAALDAGGQAADELRQVETARLDRLQVAMWPAALKGDGRAVETVLKIIDRRVKLHGLDAPQQVDITQTTEADTELARLLADAADAAARTETDIKNGTATA